MKKILVDQSGYDQFFAELEKLKQLSLSNASFGSEAYKDAVGDGWHDNFAYEESMREERIIATKIEKMIKEQALLKIIKAQNLGNEYVNIGDTIKIQIQYDEDDIEEEMLTLTGKYLPNTDLAIKEISLNSPLGQNLYQKKIGEEISYEVNNKLIYVNLIEKVENKKNQ